MSDKAKWLNEPPDPSEVLSLNKDGTGKYIPYDKIIEKLYLLCGHQWSDSNLRVTYINLPNKLTLITGTVEVELNYEINGEKINRKLSGGANFVVNKTLIPHTTASVRSLAIMSTVKILGKQFGWGLNKSEENPIPQQQVENPEDFMAPQLDEHKIQRDFIELEKKLNSFEFKEDAAEYLESTSFKHLIKAKTIVNNKKSKTN